MKSLFEEFFSYLVLSGFLFLCLFSIFFVSPWFDLADLQMYGIIFLGIFVLFASVIFAALGLDQWRKGRPARLARRRPEPSRSARLKVGMDMQRWEYCQVMAYGSKHDKQSGEITQEKWLQVVGPDISETYSGSDADLNQVLNSLGEQGWEGFGHAIQGLTYSVLLKRPLNA